MGGKPSPKAAVIAPKHEVEVFDESHVVVEHYEEEEEVHKTKFTYDDDMLEKILQ